MKLAKARMQQDFNYEHLVESMGSRHTSCFGESCLPTY